MSKPSLYGRLPWCPRCGVRGLERDKNDHGKTDVVEYLCRVCRFGFRIMPSRRAFVADQLHKEHRQVRTGQFHENVTAEAREAFEGNYPEPWKFKLWRAWRRGRGIEQDTNTHARSKDPENKLV